MLNKLKKSLIILLSCIAINYSISAAELQARAKSSSQYFMDSSRILSSYYATSATVSLNSGFAIDKNTGAQFTGTYVEFNEVGNPQVIRNYKNGSPDGKWYFFNESRGLIRVTNYSNGVKDGEEIEFNDNGISSLFRYFIFVNSTESTTPSVNLIFISPSSETFIDSIRAPRYPSLTYKLIIPLSSGYNKFLLRISPIFIPDAFISSSVV